MVARPFNSGFGGPELPRPRASFQNAGFSKPRNSVCSRLLLGREVAAYSGLRTEFDYSATSWGDTILPSDAER